MQRLYSRQCDTCPMFFRVDSQEQARDPSFQKCWDCREAGIPHECYHIFAYCDNRKDFGGLGTYCYVKGCVVDANRKLTKREVRQTRYYNDKLKSRGQI